MKIIFSSNSSWSVYNFRKNLLLSLKDTGYDIIVVAPKGKYLDKLIALGFQVHAITLDNSSVGIFTNLQYIFDLYKAYKYITPDVVLHNAVKPNIYGALVCRLLKIPVINNISGLGTIFLSNNISSKLGKLLYSISLKKVNTIFFQNPVDLSLFLKKKLVNEDQSILIPGSGIDLKRFRPKNDIRDNNITKFCFVGRLLRDKGIFEFIEAVKYIKSKDNNCEFYILGELYEQNPTAISQGTLDNWISQKLVTFLGKTDTVENEFQKFDCIVLPSYREGLSRVLLEASAMAIPAITTDVPGCNDVIEHGKNGLLCKVKDSQSLIKQIEAFIALTNEERQQMGRYGRKKVEEQFDEKIVIQAYLYAISKIKDK